MLRRYSNVAQARYASLVLRTILVADEPPRSNLRVSRLQASLQTRLRLIIKLSTSRLLAQKLKLSNFISNKGKNGHLLTVLFYSNLSPSHSEDFIRLVGFHPQTWISSATGRFHRVPYSVKDLIASPIQSG